MALWTEAADAELLRAYPDEPTAAVARRLGRSVRAIYARAAKWGVIKSAAYLAGPQACRLRRGDNVGAATRFRPGHIPANKGLRRPAGWGPGRMKETQFRRGQLNGMAARRVKPIGATRLVDGYVYRKVSAVPGPWTRNWKVEHVLVWERAHGPIPVRHCVIFINGNRRDIRLDNLTCISRRELMRRNTVHNLPAPLRQTVQLLGALRRQIRRRTHGEEQDSRSA